MKSDLTRETFQRQRHYRRVVQQQGRVPIDADWNEQAEIQKHHDETEAADVIGKAGFPQGSSFQLAASPDGRDLLVDDGRGYVDGILAENENAALDVLAFSAANQVRLRTLVLDGLALRAGEWLLIDDPVVNDPTKRFRIQSLDAATQTITLTVNLPPALVVARTTVKRITSYTTQPEWYQPDFVNQPALPALPALSENGVFLAYLDVWRRQVTALEDPLLREVALGGADTCTREKTVWQVKLRHIKEGQPTDCSTPLPSESSTGRLSARARQPASGDSPCVITPGARYRSLENQLYRVEIHDAGAVGSATYKFSRDNGMVMVSWLASSGPDLTVSSLGRDKVLGFASGQWIELLDDSVDQSQGPGTLVKIKKVDPATNTITIDDTTVYPPLPAGRGYDIARFPLHPRVRRWDHVSTTAALTVTRPPGDGYVNLEQGVQVRFEDGNYVSGDYWLIPARTITADVEWPRNELGDPLPQARRGVRHHIARLGVVTIAGGLVTGVTDCRPQFPPLTQLPPTGGGPGCCCGVMIQPTDDPQTIIDNAIAKAAGGRMTGLTIEFAAGTFRLKTPIRIAAPKEGGGHLVVRGCGSATQLLAADQENVLRIVGWQSATVTDLFAQAGTTGIGAGARQRPDQEPPPEADRLRHLLGVVYIRNCTMARAERLDLKCAAGPRRQATCLTVWNDVTQRGGLAGGQSWVRECRLAVGHLQVGVLLVNQLRATVQDNYVETYALTREGVLAITTSPEYRARYRRMIARDVVLAQPGAERAVLDGLANHDFAIGGTRILFRADSELGTAWTNVLRTEGNTAFRSLLTPLAETPARPRRERPARPAPARPEAPAPHLAPLRPTLGTPAGTTRQMQRRALETRTRFNKMAHAILHAALEPDARTALTPAQLKPFRDWIAAQQAIFTSTASAGIVIAGITGTDLRVLDNTVIGALDGIHLGFSHASGGRENVPDTAERVQIVGNTVAVAVPADVQRGLHRGVFVGNARSIAISRNIVTVGFAGKQRPVVDGVSVWGLEGPMIIVSENDVHNATVGVRMIVTGTVERPQWQALNNATFGCSANVIASPPVVQSGNRP
jgi:hypothetical protein